MKFGYQGGRHQDIRATDQNQTRVNYTFNNTRPVSLLMNIGTWETNNITRTDAFYAQDEWTLGRLTLQGALRYDHAWSWAPADHNGWDARRRVSCTADQLSSNARRRRAFTTSRHGWAPPTTCSEPARRL